MWSNFTDFPLWVFLCMYLLSIVGWLTITADLHEKINETLRTVLSIFVFCSLPFLVAIAPLASGVFFVTYFLSRFAWSKILAVKRSRACSANSKIQLTAKLPKAIARFIPSRLLNRR